LRAKSRASFIAVDLTKSGDTDTMIAQAIECHGRIDILLANAGIYVPGDIVDNDPADWDQMISLNVNSVFRSVRAVLSGMSERRSGDIIVTSSISGHQALHWEPVYSASKHAIEALSNALRYELYPFGIHTILIQPGYIVTNIQSTAMDLAQTYQEKFKTGPYAKIYASYLGNATSTRARSKTTPEDCARIMLKAIEAPRPKARYDVTPLATFAKLAKWALTDSAADRMIRRRYGIKREN